MEEEQPRDPSKEEVGRDRVRGAEDDVTKEPVDAAHDVGSEGAGPVAEVHADYKGEKRETAEEPGGWDVEESGPGEGVEGPRDEVVYEHQEDACRV